MLSFGPEAAESKGGDTRSLCLSKLSYHVRGYARQHAPVRDQTRAVAWWSHFDGEECATAKHMYSVYLSAGQKGGRCRTGLEIKGRGFSGLHQHQLMMMRRQKQTARISGAKMYERAGCNATPTLSSGPGMWRLREGHSPTSHLCSHTSKVIRAAIPPVRRGRPDSS
jgi:hypothetical protein